MNIPEACEPMSFDNAEQLGYLTMLVALSTIIIAVKHYRDRHLDGKIRFGTSFRIGFFISLIATLGYVLGWEIFHQQYAPDFGAQYLSYQVDTWQEQGLDSAEVALRENEMAAQMEQYDSNRLYRTGFSVIEILPMGILVSLLTALVFYLIDRRKFKS